MKHYKTFGLYDIESDVWDFYSLKEMYQHNKDSENWKQCLKDANKYFGQRWHDNEVRYYLNGHPVYKNIYTIVGFEDNNAWADYYWILRPLGEKDDKNDRYELWNCHYFYKNVIFVKYKKNKKNGKIFKGK